MHEGLQAETAIRQGKELGIGQAIGQIAATEAQQPLLVIEAEHRVPRNP
jgi:hypothetical protein